MGNCQRVSAALTMEQSGPKPYGPKLMLAAKIIPFLSGLLILALPLSETLSSPRAIINADLWVFSLLVYSFANAAATMYTQWWLRHKDTERVKKVQGDTAESRAERSELLMIVQNSAGQTMLGLICVALAFSITAYPPSTFEQLVKLALRASALFTVVSFAGLFTIVNTFSMSTVVRVSALRNEQQAAKMDVGAPIEDAREGGGEEEEDKLIEKPPAERSTESTQAPDEKELSSLKAISQAMKADWKNWRDPSSLVPRLGVVIPTTMLAGLSAADLFGKSLSVTTGWEWITFSVLAFIAATVSVTLTLMSALGPQTGFKLIHMFSSVYHFAAWNWVVQLVILVVLSASREAFVWVPLSPDAEPSTELVVLYTRRVYLYVAMHCLALINGIHVLSNFIGYLYTLSPFQVKPMLHMRIRKYRVWLLVALCVAPAIVEVVNLSMKYNELIPSRHLRIMNLVFGTITAAVWIASILLSVVRSEPTMFLTDVVVASSNLISYLLFYILPFRSPLKESEDGFQASVMYCVFMLFSFYNALIGIRLLFSFTVTVRAHSE